MHSPFSSFAIALTVEIGEVDSRGGRRGRVLVVVTTGGWRCNDDYCGDSPAAASPCPVGQGGEVSP